SDALLGDDTRPGHAPAAHRRDPGGTRRQGGNVVSRLVVQHPRLSDAAVAAFRAALGRAPTLHLPQLATWEPVTIDGDRVGAIAAAVGAADENVPTPARPADHGRAKGLDGR